mgnify:CR=1 FL=1
MISCHKLCQIYSPNIGSDMSSVNLVAENRTNSHITMHHKALKQQCRRSHLISEIKWDRWLKTICWVFLVTLVAIGDGNLWQISTYSECFVSQSRWSQQCHHNPQFTIRCRGGRDADYNSSPNSLLPAPSSGHSVNRQNSSCKLMCALDSS